MVIRGTLYLVCSIAVQKETGTHRTDLERVGGWYLVAWTFGKNLFCHNDDTVGCISDRTFHECQTLPDNVYVSCAAHLLAALPLS